MANPICLSPLKFYDSLKKQERFKSYTYNHISPVIMPFNVLYPFQFVIPSNIKKITGAYIYDANSNSDIFGNILQQLKEDGLTIITASQFNVIMFPGIFPLQMIKHEGEYYLRIDTITETFYSEVFCFTNSLDGYVEIEYWNPESDFGLKNGIITFSNNFHFKLLLKTELGKPDYRFEEEATTRFGYNFIESQISKKVYRFNTVIPEYLCDALRIIRLCSNKVLTNKSDKYEMLSFEMDVDWQDQGDLASVTCEFEVDNILMNLGGLKYEQVGGDFNNDFNNDFLNK